MERFWKYRLDHVIFWVATIFFHMFTRRSLLEQAGFFQFILEIIIRNGLLAVIIYANLNLLIPRYARKGKWWGYVTSLIALFAFYIAIKNLHDVYRDGYVLGLEEGRQYFRNTLYNFSIAVFYVSFSIALYLSREWYAQRELIRKIEVEKLNTELEYLKAQINPHFLFNSINTIYFQIDKNNTQARQTLSAFSDMLRYQLYECNGHEIAVEKEIAYLKNYVDIQRLRRDENYSIVFDHDQVNGFSIAPLLLIPFVENAFKHVSHKATGNEIRITLSRTADRFGFRVMNTTDPASFSSSSQGIGLRNVKRRLELLYNGRHTLNIAHPPGKFEVCLELMIQPYAY